MNVSRLVSSGQLVVLVYTGNSSWDFPNVVEFPTYLLR